MTKNEWLPVPAAPFQCPLANLTQQLIPMALRPLSPDEFFPEEQFACSKVKVSRFYGASVSTLNRWIREGRIRTFKRGTCFFFYKPQLLDVLTTDEKISAFIIRKERERSLGIVRKQPARKPRIHYTAVLLPGETLVYLEIRFKGMIIACRCNPSLLENKDVLYSFASDMIRFHNCSKALNAVCYEKN